MGDPAVSVESPVCDMCEARGDYAHSHGGTGLLCATMLAFKGAGLEDNVMALVPELGQWWSRHQKDARWERKLKAETERRRRRFEEVRATGLAKLTEDERQALGIWDDEEGDV